MKLLAHRLALIGVVSGALLTASSAAVAETGKAPERHTDCVVQYLNEHGKTARTETTPEGREYGKFRCVDAQWVYDWNPTEADDWIAAKVISIDLSGIVSARQFTGPALSRDLTLDEIIAINQAVTGSGEVTIGRAVVAVDDGRERTPEEIEAILAGKDTTGVRVLDTIEKPDSTKSMKDIIVGAGGEPESTVVYLSIWGAIKNAFKWVVKVIVEVGDWIDRNCNWSASPYGDVAISCRIF